MDDGGGNGACGVWQWIVEGGGPLEEGEFWNVNFPHPEGDGKVPEIVECPVSRRPLPVDFAREGEGVRYTGVLNEREWEEGSDVEVCFGGRIVIHIPNTESE